MASQTPGQVSGSLQVFFEEPFYVGLFEKREAGRLRVCKITFGPEPTDAQVLAYVQQQYGQLLFSAPIKGEKPAAGEKNHKQRQREARRQTAQAGIGTRAQQALQAQRELHKQEKKAHTKAEREVEAARRFAMAQQKRKEKHRGR